MVVSLMTLQQAQRRLGGTEVNGRLAYLAAVSGGGPYGGRGIPPSMAFTAASGLIAPGHSFAVLTQRHMHLYGTKREHLAEVAISQRNNAIRRPTAIRKDPITLDDYFNARMINDPFCLFDYTMENTASLSAAIILQLAKIEELDLKQAASAVVYVIALGITFAIREYLAKEPEFKDWSPPWPWKKHKRHRLLRTFYRLIDEKQWDQAAEMLTDDCRSHILANEVVVAGSVVGPQTMSQWFSDNLNHVQTQREIQRIKDDGPASVVFTRVTVTSADGKSKSNSAWVDVFRFNGSLIAEHVGLPSH